MHHLKLTVTVRAEMLVEDLATDPKARAVQINDITARVNHQLQHNDVIKGLSMMKAHVTKTEFITE